MNDLEQARESVSEVKSKIHTLKMDLERGIYKGEKLDEFERFRLINTIEFLEGLLEHYTNIRDELEESLLHGNEED